MCPAFVGLHLVLIFSPLYPLSSRLLFLIFTTVNGVWSLFEFLYLQLFGVVALVQGFSGT